MPRPVSVKTHIRKIRSSIKAIERALQKLTPVLSSNGTRPMASKGKRRLKLSPERRAALKRHGQYLGRIRGLTPRQRARVKAVKAKQGYVPAIKLAKQLGKRAS